MCRSVLFAIDSKLIIFVLMDLHLLNALAMILMGSREKEEINILTDLPFVIRYPYTIFKSIYY